MNDQDRKNSITSGFQVENYVEAINLENYLNEKRPDIWKKFEERKKCITQLKNLR